MDISDELRSFLVKEASSNQVDNKLLANTILAMIAPPVEKIAEPIVEEVVAPVIVKKANKKSKLPFVLKF